MVSSFKILLFSQQRPALVMKADEGGKCDGWWLVAGL